MVNQTVLCISNRRWDALWGESQKVMSRIAQRNRVLYFEPGRSVNEPLFSEMRRNFVNFFYINIKRLNKNLILIPSPPSLPIGRRHLPRNILSLTTPLVIRINNLIMIKHIQSVLRKMGVEPSILWVLSPYQHGLIGRFGEKLSCYHNYDEFPEFLTSVRIKKIVQYCDDELTKRVNIVFATSRGQFKRRKKINPNTYFVPNGVDFQLFNKALTDLPLPLDLKEVPRPIVGFAGMLGNHIDVKLLLDVAEVYPDYSLILVGPDFLPDSLELRRLREKPNVFFLGLKPLDELPTYLRVFDVALIPYALVGHVLFGYPQKLLEYLAAGRAIVATAMPELRPYRYVARIGETREKFVEYVKESLHDYAPEKIRVRVAVAEDNTWDHRVMQMYQIIDRLLAKRCEVNLGNSSGE